MQQSHRPLSIYPDFVVLLQRYVYWLKDDQRRKVNVLGVDDNNNTGMKTQAMIGNLKTNWSSARFHVAILNENMHWRCILIDRKSHSFEYYDPKGTGLDLTNTVSPLSIQVSALYEATRAMDDQLITQSMHSIRRGFHSHQKEGTECGMYVIMFVHSRVAQQRSFEEFANTEIKDADCKQLKDLFFTRLGKEVRSTETQNIDYRVKYGAYDIRLAALDFVRYMQYVIDITEVPLQKQKITMNQTAFLKMAQSSGDYVALRVEGMKMQRDVLEVLPSQFKMYAGTNIWVNIIQEIVQDPFTKFLRNISEGKGKRSKSTVRRTVAMKYFHDSTSWSMDMAAPGPAVQELRAFMRELIDVYYVPLLAFDEDNVKRFHTGMVPESFIKECMIRQEFVSFGVHFLREVENYVIRSTNFGTRSDLTTKYSTLSILVKPVSAKNMNEIKVNINKCESSIQEAYAMIRSTFGMVQTQANNTSNSVDLPLLPIQPQNLQIQLVDSIIQLNKKDMEDRTFMTGGLQPWNFPIDVVEFNATLGTPLPDNYNLYSVNNADMRKLLTSEAFKVHYAMGIMMVQHYIASGVLQDVNSIYVIVVSLVQFYNATDHLSDNRSIVCTLLDQMYAAVTSPAVNIPGLQKVIEFSARFRQSCDTTQVQTDFFRRVNQEFTAIFGYAQ